MLRASPPAPADAPVIEAALMGVGRDANRPVALRVEALAAVSGGLPRVEPDLFTVLQKALAPSEPVALRMKAASCFERARLDEAQLLALTAAIPTAGPMELPRLLPAFDQSGDPTIGTALLDALSLAKGRSNVSPELLRPRLASIRSRSGSAARRCWPPGARTRHARPRSSTRCWPASAAAITCAARCSSTARRPPATPATPSATRAARSGPDLTSIGQIRSERDLLEAIVFPNASFARGFESVVVTTTTGEAVTGVLKSEGDAIVLVLVDGQERRIPRADVADMQPGAISLMPAGFAEQLSRQELADLLAFLKGTRWGA